MASILGEPMADLAIPRNADGWFQATPARGLEFPADHAAHPDYRIEWWYYTGHLQSTAGRRFGFELTFFRTGIVREPLTPSRWAIRDLYLAHFAVSDLDRQTFVYASQLQRAGIGAAGTDADVYRVWNGPWSANLDGDVHVLQAEDSGVAVRLRLQPTRPPIRHGEHGYSRKGTDPGNASHYYSLTRLAATGTVTAGGAAHEVTGLCWMDHEFGSSFLEPGTVGWDWLSLHLDDGRDLMLYRLRRADGSIAPQSSGTLVATDGTAHSFLITPTVLQPGTPRWRSAKTQAEYPISWQVDLPGERLVPAPSSVASETQPAALRLTITTPLANQEMVDRRSPSLSYWEGAVEAVGTQGGQPVTGQGYLELTGYAGGMLQRALQ